MSMVTPVLIANFDPWAPGSGIATQGLGPFQNSTSKNLYTVFQTFTPSIQMYVSTDDGATWNVIDEAGQPTDVFETNYCAVYDDSTGLITLLYLAPQNFPLSPWAIVQFDTVAGTWGAEKPSPEYTQANYEIGGAEGIVQRTAGDFVIVADATDTVNAHDATTVVFWSPGGGWIPLNPATDIIVPGTDALNLTAYCAIAGADGRVHVFGATANTGNDLYHFTVDSTNTISAIDGPIATDIATGRGSNFIATIWGAYNPVTDTLAIGYINDLGVFTTLTAPEQEIPVWTATPLASTYLPGTPDFEVTNTAVIAVDGVTYYFRILGPAPFTIQQWNGTKFTTILTFTGTQPQRISVGEVDGAPALVYDLDPTGGQDPTEVFYSTGGSGPIPPPPIPGPTQVVINQNTLGFIALPNPAKRCTVFGQERCVKVSKKRILRGKAYTYARI